MAKTTSDSEEQLPQGESPYPLEPTPSDPQRPRFDRLQIAQSPLLAILAIAAVIIVIVVIVLLVRSDSKEESPTPNATQVALESQVTQLAMLMQTQTVAAQGPTSTATVDPTLEALQAQATQLAVVVQTQTAVAQIPSRTTAAQVIVITATPEPQVVMVTPTRLPPTAAKPTSTQPPPIGATCGSRTGDDINVGRDSGGPCGSMSLDDFLDIMNAALGPMPKPYYDKLDAAFNASGGDIGYQYRVSIPAYIPASSQPAMRVMWGDLGWVGQLSEADKREVESRILRLRCESQYGVCIYLLTDAGGFEIGYQGRGILLSQPLNPESQFPWWG